MPKIRNAAKVPDVLKFIASLQFAMTLVGCSTRQALPRRSPDETVVPFALTDNRIVVSVFLNEKGPYSFIFDTGGARSNTLTPEVARELGLQVEAGEEAGGAGNLRVPSGKTLVAKYSIGDLVLQDQSFMVLDLNAIQKAFSFPRLDGIIGFDVLKRSVTCIDYENMKLTFRNSGPGCFGDGGAAIAFKIKGDSPFISGKVNGIPTELFVDTGDRSAFSVFQKFAKKNDLENIFEASPEVMTGVGIGGPIPGRLAVLASLELGTQIKLRDVLSRLPSTHGGFFATSPAIVGGSVGNEVLRRFNVVLDYRKNLMTLFKNAHFGDPFEFHPPRLDQR